MLAGLRPQERPVNEIDEVRVTVPVKLLTGVTVMVDAPVAPATIVRFVGLTVTVKSGSPPTS